MTYQLIALDVDGTTVNTGRPPSPRVLRALAGASAAGVRVVLATGRAFDSAQAYAASLGLHDPLICFQGALVKEQSDGHPTLLADCLPAGALHDVIAFADRENLELMLYTEDEIYVERQYHGQPFYDLWFSMPTHLVTDLGATARRLTASGEGLLKGLFIGEPRDLGPLEERLNVMLAGRLAVTRSHDFFLEVVGPRVSKGHALSFLAERYAIPQAATIAVGDSGNDISMIRWAGLGVAVANAQQDVLAAADWIAPSVDEDGVAAVVEQFVLAGR